MITATQIQYLHICRRKAWLFSHHIFMEQESGLVLEGRLIHEHSYKERQGQFTEFSLEGGKIDFWDAKNKVVHEVKKSDKFEFAHIAQVKYYLYLLKNYGIEGASGILEYPKLRQRHEVLWEEGDEERIEGWVAELEQLLQGPCPPVIDKPFCSNCAYYEYCYVED
jgi:CRISPR-associated exonuclease Cas4